ncbi:MAG: hypothetical protein EHM45_04390 [Desulfobacteraceae bacterium]|nr:MAG: hypothetical protein EHM45_04390 [Desulfobacteraceae bacterium]
MDVGSVADKIVVILVHLYKIVIHAVPYMLLGFLLGFIAVILCGKLKLFKRKCIDDPISLGAYRLISLFLFGVLLCVFTACSLSPLSDKTISDPALLGIHITLQRYQTGYTDGNVYRGSRIQVWLTDIKDKCVFNRHIQMKVNGQKMGLNDNRYLSTDYCPAYSLFDQEMPVMPDSTYTFTIVLSNGREYVVCSIHTQPDITPERFATPVSHSRSKELVLKWNNQQTGSFSSNAWLKMRDLSSSTELMIHKIMETEDTSAFANEKKEFHASKIIGSGKGSLTIPASVFNGSSGKVSELSIEFDSVIRGKISEPFLPSSSFQVSQDFSCRIEMID